MIIRHANYETDALAIVEGAKQFAERAEMGRFISGDDNFIEAVSRVVTLDSVEVLVAEIDGKIIGGIGILYSPYIWDATITTADELFWFAANDAPFKTGSKLMKQAMENINNRGAVPMFRKLETSPSGVDKFYRKNGLTPIETVYTRVS